MIPHTSCTHSCCCLGSDSVWVGRLGGSAALSQAFEAAVSAAGVSCGWKQQHNEQIGKYNLGTPFVSVELDPTQHGHM